MSNHWLIRVVFIVILVLLDTSTSLAQTTVDWRCDEQSCTQEFEFLFVDSQEEGGVGKVSLLVEKNPALFKFPVVGFYEEHYGGLGDQWRASAWVAATFAALHGYDLTRRITYTVSRPIQGPSASAALTVALIAALEKPPAQLNSAIVMTGVLNPDGTIGPVDGIAAKVRAAERYGKATILIPKGQLDSEILAIRDAANARRQQEDRPRFLVEEVQNLAQAYKAYTGQNVSFAGQATDPVRAAELPDPFGTVLRQRVSMRIAHAEAVDTAWKAERDKNPPVNAVALAQLGQAVLARAKNRPSSQPAAAYEDVLHALEALQAAVACARDARADRTVITVGDANDGPKAIDRVIGAIKDNRPASPTEVSVLAGLGGMVEVYKQYLGQQNEAREKYVQARMGSNAGPPAGDVADARLAFHRADAVANSISRRLADYLAVWQGVELSRSLLKFTERGGRASYPPFTAAQGIAT